MNLEGLKLKLTAVFEPAPEGGYTCHFEELPEIFSEGETVEEARANLVDALTQVMRWYSITCEPRGRANASDGIPPRSSAKEHHAGRIARGVPTGRFVKRLDLERHL